MLPGLTLLHDGVDVDGGYSISLLCSFYFNQSMDKIVAYFEGLVSEGVTVDDFLITISKYETNNEKVRLVFGWETVSVCYM